MTKKHSKLYGYVAKVCDISLRAEAELRRKPSWCAKWDCSSRYMWTLTRLPLPVVWCGHRRRRRRLRREPTIVKYCLCDTLIHSNAIIEPHTYHRCITLETHYWHINVDIFPSLPMTCHCLKWRWRESEMWCRWGSYSLRRWLSGPVPTDF